MTINRTLGQVQSVQQLTPASHYRRLEKMSNKWYSRPVLFVSDIDRSVDFYVKQFGFTENWRFDSAGGKASVAQVARPGMELILAAESPEKMGKGLMFIS